MLIVRLLRCRVDPLTVWPQRSRKYRLGNNLVTVFLHAVVRLASSLFPQCICTPETSLFQCLFSVALVQASFTTVHTLYLCFLVISNQNVDFIFCTKCPMYRIKKFIETAELGKWHNYFSLEDPVTLRFSEM